MIAAVFDSNVLVSALWSKDGIPAKLLNSVLNSQIRLYYDSSIMLEYRAVLLRPRFCFASEEVEAFLQFIGAYSFSVVATPLPVSFSDASDRKFYEVAKAYLIPLVTGNKKHYPDDSDVLTPREFWERYMG